ncbi:MAG: response regulator [Nitrospinae bacterium]|nr:response regulator [Nitrospinota bacterium]MBF0634340.1 response regulator [Nitrospinota bacterium]
MNKMKKQTILAVDDTPENLDILVGLLGEEYKVKASPSGERALKIAFSDTPPDLILLDIMMPEMDGYEVISRLKADERAKKIPVIFLTGRVAEVDEAKGLDLGAVDYIVKPFSPPIVKRRVRTHLALYDQNRELEMKVVERTAELNRTRLAIIQRLGRAAEFKDNETGLHVIRMSHYSRMLAIKIGMTEEEADRMLNAAPMHDLGKIGIPDNILLKPGKLNVEEWKLMQQHPAWGVEIIGDHENSELLEWAATIALTHHEKWNGSGYPKGLKGKDIPIIGRIVAVADVFDALTSERPYKKEWSVEEAMVFIKKEAGAHFDPDIIMAFENILPDILEIMGKYAEPSRDQGSTV